MPFNAFNSIARFKKTGGGGGPLGFFGVKRGKNSNWASH